VELKLKTPWRDGTTHLVMSPLEFMQRLAALVPRPRLHLIRFHGVLAPNAKLRALVVPQGPEQPGRSTEVATGTECEAEHIQGRPGRISWARLLKRVFDIDMQHCPNCGGGELKIIAAILERPVIEKILEHLGLQPRAPQDAPMPPDAAAQAWFIDDYATARADFLKRGDVLASAFARVERFAIPVSSRDGTSGLFVDGLYIPAQGGQKRRLIVVSSGVHGVEGPTGSAVQRLFMQEALTAQQLAGPLADTGVLLLHAVNPWGFAQYRRFTENNVDLNRNASADAALYRTVNAGYPLVDPLVNPDQPADVSAVEHRFFHLRVVSMIAQHGMRALRQAVLQGQYQVPKGIYFGGQALEPQLAALGPQIVPILNAYPLSLSLDLHTGYGARGTLHLFFDPPKNPRARQGLEMAFAGQRIDWASGDDFYTLTGDFVGWLSQLRSGTSRRRSSTGP